MDAFIICNTKNTKNNIINIPKFIYFSSKIIYAPSENAFTFNSKLFLCKASPAIDRPRPVPSSLEEKPNSKIIPFSIYSSLIPGPLSIKSIRIFSKFVLYNFIFNSDFFLEKFNQYKLFSTMLQIARTKSSLIIVHSIFSNSKTKLTFSNSLSKNTKDSFITSIKFVNFGFVLFLLDNGSIDLNNWLNLSL